MTAIITAFTKYTTYIPRSYLFRSTANMSSKGPNAITLIETNGVNQPTATYIYTESQEKPRDGARTGRIDLIVCYTFTYLIDLHHT